jgi:hypothetical protein
VVKGDKVVVVWMRWGNEGRVLRRIIVAGNGNCDL